jgi:hypothetical protein
MEAVEALKLVQRIYTRLNARRPEIDLREQYVSGNQPLNFATAEWKKANSERYSGFSDNWCAPVVNAEAERIRYTGMKFADDTDSKMSKMLQEYWLLNEMEAQSSQGFVTSLATSRSFVIVWGDSDGQPMVSWEHPSNVEIEYDFENPMVRRAALKTWVDEDLEYATLYTASEVWKFERKRASEPQDRDSQAEQARTKSAADGGWLMREVGGEPWPLVNPLGVVPVVEVPNRPTLMGDPVSEIQCVIPMQDAINLLWAYLFLAADYASMDARVVTGSGPPMTPIIDLKPDSPTFGTKIGEKPVDLKDLREKRLLYLDNPDAKIDSWSAARLDIFTDTIDVAVGHIASQTRTPPTYLVSKTGMSNVNGEGLKASEIGLNKKVQEFQTFASPAMREVNRLIALVLDDLALAKIVPLGKVTWMNPEIRSEAQLADMLVKKKSIGYPLEYLMELDGVETLDVPRILAMKKAEEEAALDFGVQAANDNLTSETAPDVAV